MDLSFGCFKINVSYDADTFGPASYIGGSIFTMLNCFSKARKAIRGILTAGAVLSLAACDATMLPSGGSDSGGGPNLKSGETVQIALLIPQSDPNTGNIPQSLENAARLAIAEIPGANIELKVYDTAGRAGTAAAQAQRAVDEGAKLILGPLFGEAANAAAVAVADEGVNVLSFSNNTTIAGGNLFILGSTFDSAAERLVSYGARNGKKNIAVLYQNNIAGQLGRNAIQGAATRNGGQVVAAEGYELNTESLTAAIGRVKSATSGGAADSLYLTDSWDGGLSVVLQLAPEQGVSPASTQYAGITRWDVRSDGFKLPGIEGAWFAIPDNASTSAFEQRYAARYGAQPHALAGLAFDGVAAVGALLKKGRNDALTRSALTQGAGFQGASGVFRLLNNGTNQRAMGVATVRNQQVVILDPAPRSFGGAGF